VDPRVGLDTELDAKSLSSTVDRTPTPDRPVRKKVKQSRYTPWRRLGGEEV
jgi:hypothetical protein